MWRLNINEPGHDAYWVELQPGTTSIGRGSQNVAALHDPAASRQHAEIIWDRSGRGGIVIQDLNSTNGTYVNHKRISAVVELKSGDNIRIGKAILYLSEDGDAPVRSVRGTHFFTREIILEALDEHAVLIDEVAQKLNAVLDVPSMRREIVSEFKRILLMEDVFVFLEDELKSIQDERARRSAQNRTVEITSAQMYVPITESDKVEGVICLTRKANAQPFSQRDMGLAVAISHQAGLTLSRLRLLEKSREHERMRELLLRFVSPVEADYLLKDYLSSGQLPELVEQKVTILFCDVANSTSIAERVGAKTFAGLLAQYYREVTEIIFRYGGVIKYMGDGIMAAFVSTSAQTVVPQEVRAVEAGRKILAQIRSTNYLPGEEPLTIGVAVNTGTAMVGYIGVGARAEFIVVGDTVNIASRMEALARPNRLLIGASTLQMVADKFPVQPIGEIDMRGRSAPVQIYEVVSYRA